MIHLPRSHEDATVPPNNAVDLKSRQVSGSKGPRRRSSALRFFASNSPSKPDIQPQSHKQWESDYLKSLRANRPSRPSGSRPLPAKNGVSAEPFARAASALSFRPTPSKPEHGDTHPKVQERATSALSHRRAQSDMPRTGLFGSLNGRPMVQTPHARRSTRDFSASTARTQDSPERSPIAYRENGMRWMEKQEARSLREALEEMDFRDEAKVHAGAQDEASELVWNHMNDKLPDQVGRPRRDYTEHLREGAHARSQSRGWYDEFKSPTKKQESGVSPVNEGKPSESDSHIPEDQNLDDIHQKGVFDERQEPQKRTHVKWDSPEKKTYTNLAFQVPPLKTSRRRSSGTKRRHLSGGPFQNPNDKIYEDDQNIEQGHSHRRTASSRIPVPLNGKTSDFPGDSQTPMKRLDSAAKVPDERNSGVHRAEIHRNPPSQSHNPTYTTNLSQKRADVVKEQPSDGPVRTEDGMEVRSEDIRAATSMRFKERSPKLPKPAFVSQQPGRHIVSFDKEWKPKHSEKTNGSTKDQGTSHATRERPRPPPPSSTASAPVIPTICVLDAHSLSENDTLYSQDIPSISVTADEVPKVSLPEEQPQKRPLPPKQALRGRPLPSHSSTTPVITSTSHWSLASQRSTTQCAACALPIAGRIVSAAAQRFHPHCFTCHHCSEPLECVAFYPEPDSKRSERLARIQARQDGNDLPEDKAGETAADDGDDSLRFYCHLDFHELFSPRCRSCKTPIESEVVVACGGTWHIGHFFCAECGDPFDSKTPFVEKNGYAWCVQCHTGRFSGKCKGCRKPVVEKVIQALEAEWHEDCFVCVECGGGFEDGRFFTREDEQKPVCVKCEERRLKQSSCHL